MDNLQLQAVLLPHVGSGGKRGPCHSPWVFIHDTDEVEEGLVVLFFDFVFSVALHPTPPLKIFLPTPLCTYDEQFVLHIIKQENESSCICLALTPKVAIYGK